VRSNNGRWRRRMQAGRGRRELFRAIEAAPTPILEAELRALANTTGR
jgi:hypothetical protein